MTDEPLELSRLESVPPVHQQRSVDPGQGPEGAPPGSSPSADLREIIVGMLLALAVALLYLGNAAAPVPESADDGGKDQALGAASDRPADRLDLRLQAQYELGIREVLDSSALGGLEALGVEEASARRLDDLAETTRERIALAPVHAQLSRESDAVERALDHLAALADDPSLPTQVRAEAAAFAGLFQQPPVAPQPDQRVHLLATYGWFARLALDRLDDLHTESTAKEGSRSPALAEARRVASSLYALALGALALFVVGVFAAATMLHRVSRGKVRSGYARRELRTRFDSPIGTEDRLPYLETSLLFLVAVTLVGAVIGLATAALGDADGDHWLLMANWTVVAVLFWPVVRGRSLADLRRAMGWHLGRGFWLEVGSGLFAYLAAMPLLAFGLAVTLLVTRFTEQTPHHPIVDWLQEAGLGGIAVVVVLAVVWAPLVEESLFRGSFYHYLRGRLGIVGSVSLVSLVFAAIHPQGLAGIPFLATLAIVLGLTREWRDSIVASVTLHMVHNGLATVVLLVLLT